VSYINLFKFIKQRKVDMLLAGLHPYLPKLIKKKVKLFVQQLREGFAKNKVNYKCQKETILCVYACVCFSIANKKLFN